MSTEAETGIVERNPSMPGLPLIFDADRLRARLRECGLLRPTHSLTVDYLRFKPGDNCIARLRCREGDRTVFGYAKAYGDQAAIKLQKAAQRPSRDSAMGIGRLQFPDLGMELNWLPNDNALPSFGAMSTVAERDSLLRRIFKDGTDWSGAHADVLSYKPERRLTAVLSHPENGRVVAKFKTPRRYERSRHVHKRLVKVDGVDMPAIKGWSRSCSVIATQWISGDSLVSAVKRGETRGCSAAGRALARFHQSANRGFRTSEEHRNVGDLAALAEDFSEILPKHSDPARALASELEGWWLKQEARSTPVHGDFNFEQVVVSEEGVAMIDFDDARMGHPMEDLGSFIARLELHALDGKISPRTVSEAVSAFIKGYVSEAGDQPGRMLKRFIALALFRRLHDPFRSRTDHWPEVTAAILARCDTIWSGTR